MRPWLCALLLGVTACTSSAEVLCDQMEACVGSRDRDTCVEGFEALRDRGEIIADELDACAACVDEAACGAPQSCKADCAGVLRFPREAE